MNRTRPLARRICTPPRHAAGRLVVTAGPDRGRAFDVPAGRVLSIGSDPAADIALTDESVSQRHAELVFDGVRAQLVDLGSTNGTRLGAATVLEAVVDPPGARLSLGETDLWLELPTDAVAPHAFGPLRGSSAPMRQLFAVLARAAAGDTTILVEGESGTGKELIAQAVHGASQRAGRPFVVVDCSAIAPTLIETELFGCERGAFTGADRARPGAFEQAHGGTLFLDEIGELPLDLQAKFLRALERRHVKRVGGSRYADVDVRVIAATNRKLADEVARGRFRGDLYYRLAVVHVVAPPLREHREDIAVLARNFLAQAGQNEEALLTDGVLAAFSAYDWPGNVRELRNAVERLVALGDLGQPLAAEAQPASCDYRAAKRLALSRFERDYARAVLARCEGVVTLAAQKAGISRQMFHRLLSRGNGALKRDGG